MMGFLDILKELISSSPETPDSPGLAVLRLIVVYLLLRYFLNNIVGRIIVPLIAKEFARDQKDRAARVKTLAGVIRSTGNYVLTFIIVLMALKAFGVDTTPVLASASVIGLAVGFGSQKLVRDVTTGFLLLAENQLDVGDYVTISGVSGVIEDIGMRTTRIRDDTGKVYIFSNGDISMVCNHSMGPVNLFLDLPVLASQDLDQLRAAIDAVGERLERKFGESLLERPHMDGLTAMTATQMTVRIRYRAVAPHQERVQMRLREEIREEFARREIQLV
jgi:small-conductance mechanosensitive channel